MRTLLTHELRCLLRDRTLLVAYLVFLVALGVAMTTGSTFLARSRQVQQTIEHAQAQHLARMRAQLEAVAAGRQPEGAFVAGRPTSIRVDVPRPVSPLLPLSIGHSELMPASATVTLTSGEGTLFDVGTLENPDHLQIGRFDLAFALVTLLPLIAIGLCYNLLSGERERGTLPLLLTQPLPLGEILLGKGVVTWAVLTLPAVVLPVAWTLIVSPEAWACWPGLVGYAVLVAGYVAFWVVLAVVVNLAGASSAANAVILGGLWLWLVVVLPGLLSVVTSRLYPVPSRLELIGEARLTEVEAMQRRDVLVDRFFQDHPELAPAQGPDQANRLLAFYLTTLETERAVNPVYERFEAQLAAQQRVVRLAQFASPAIVLREALMRLAGTSRETFSRFRRDVIALRDQLREFLLPRVARGEALTWNDYLAAPRRPSTLLCPAGWWTGALGVLVPAFVLAALAWSRCQRPSDVPVA